jgi:hypothetical protein
MEIGTNLQRFEANLLPYFPLPIINNTADARTSEVGVGKKK